MSGLTPRCMVLALCVAVAGVISASAGCAGGGSGYSFEPVYSSDVRSISVPIWENRTYYARAELDLTEALVKQIQRTTPWVVSRSGVAETTLEGAITDIRLETLSIDRTSGLVQEQGVRYTVEFTWKDNRTGQELVRRADYDGYAAFVPSLGVGERLEIGQAGAVEVLARDIVSELRTRW